VDLLNRLQEEIDQMAKSIKTDNYPMSIGELSNVYSDGDLVINPEYQRLFRWDISQQSSLIESILLNIPIPPIYVYQTDEGKWDLIDGQQRLSTIFKFMNILKNPEGETLPSEPLVKTKFLPSLAGKHWMNEDAESSLTEAQRRFIKRSKIDIVIIDKASDKYAQYEMFQRLNTGGAPLSPQEVRNCILIMNDNESYSFFKKLSVNDNFLKAIPLSERDQEQQGYMEQIVRYFVLKYSNLEVEDSANYNNFLTEEIIKIIDNKLIDNEEDLKVFERVFNLLYSLFDESAFKKYDYSKEKFLGPVLVGAYEVIIPGLVNNLDFYERTENHNKLVELIKSIYNQEQYLESIKRGVRPVTRLKRLAQFSRELFKYED
jgi:uncharacterized protein with ParB-like and HNH nuclease domain